MKKEERYICEFCGMAYETIEECKECEEYDMISEGLSKWLGLDKQENNQMRSGKNERNNA